MEATILRPRKPLLWIALAAIVGIVAADHVALPPAPLLAGAGIAAAVAIIFPSRPLCLLLVALAFAELHTMRHVESPAWRMALALNESPRAIRAEGVVWSQPVAFTDGRGRQRATFWMKTDHLTGAGIQRGIGGLCLVRWSGVPPALGDLVEIAGSAQALEETRNPGEFDTAAWLRRQGVYFQIVTPSQTDCHITGHDAGPWGRAYATSAREWINERLALGLPHDPETSALISSMVLGMRGETPPEMKDLFQKTGTLHLFAVSGLNVAMLATIAWHVLKPLRIRRGGATLVIIPLLAAYAIITGLGASCVRATVMAAIILLAPLLARRASPMNGIAAAALAILAWDTNQLFSPGFQLSFVLVLVIIALARPIQRRIEAFALPDEFIPRRLWTAAQRTRIAAWGAFAAAAGVTLSAWIGSLLFMAGYFHLVSPAAIVANLVAVPLAFIVLSLGLFSLLAGLLAAPLAVIVNHANWLSAKALLGAVAAFSKIPGGHVYVELPRPGPEPACEITVLDAGEGAVVHLRADGRDWLVDAGHQRDYERTLLPYLRSRGVNRLEGIILTHGDSTHVGGAAAVIWDFAPRWIADTPDRDLSSVRRSLHAELAARSLGRRFLSRGDSIALGPDATLRVLYPPREIERTQADDKALVLMLEAQGRRVLLTSDAGFHTEQWMLAHEPGLLADVLVKGWADRDLSGTPDFIAAAAPRAIICSGEEFGKSADSLAGWMAPIVKNGTVVLPQSRHGAVRIAIFRDAGIRVETWRP